MSFILDALKKSETDRQERATPGIADVPTAIPNRKSSKWIPVIVALLAINSVALIIVLMQSNEPPVATTIPDLGSTGVGREGAAAGESTTAAREALEERSVPVVRRAQRNAEAEEPAAETATVMPRPERVTTVPRSAPMEEVRAGVMTGTVDNETLLTFNDIRASGSINLPDMHIDLHVFSEDPSGRFVFINMNQYRENATMAEGPTVRRITAEGVILEYRGSAFLLPRE